MWDAQDEVLFSEESIMNGEFAMISITLETYWRIDGPVSSTLYALKDTIEQAQAWIASQERHYNTQGFAVKWQMFEHLTCVNKGHSEPADEYTKYPYICCECHQPYSWSAEDLSWQYEKPFLPCGHSWGTLEMVFEQASSAQPPDDFATEYEQARAIGDRIYGPGRVQE